MRAVATGALDRAVDVAATLEVRGYGSARRPPVAHRPWSRHDMAFAASAVALVLGAVAAHLGGAAPFDAYPRLQAPLGAGVAVACALAVVAALAPFAARRGIA